MTFKFLDKSTLGELFPSRYGYKYLERGMKVVGWLPPARNSPYYWMYRIWNVIITFIMVIYLPIAFFGSYFIDFEGFTPGDFLTSVQVAFNAACLALKIVVLVPKMECFKKAKNMLDVIDRRCVRKEDKIQVHRCVILCNYTYMIYQAVYSSYATMTYLSSAITGSTPWGFYLPFVDYRDGKRSFWVAATLEYIIGATAVFCDQLIDVYPVIFGYLLRIHLKLLIERVERLNTSKGENEEESYEELVNCIKDHKLLLEFCNVFRPAISGTIFAQFLVIGLGLGLSMMNLLFFSNFWTGLATAAFIVVLMIETFPFCYICELINEDCNKLTSAIFHSKWIDANKRYKSTLIYFLHQSQQSIKFIAGGIFPISMQTNIEVAKLAFAVVTVVKQMNIVEKLMKD